MAEEHPREPGALKGCMIDALIEEQARKLLQQLREWLEAPLPEAMDKSEAAWRNYIEGRDSRTAGQGASRPPEGI